MITEVYSILPGRLRTIHAVSLIGALFTIWSASLVEAILALSYVCFVPLFVALSSPVALRIPVLGSILTHLLIARNERSTHVNAPVAVCLLWSGAVCLH